MNSISPREKNSCYLYPGIHMNMESVICENVLDVDTPVDVPFHLSRPCDDLNSAEHIYCENTKNGVPSSSICLNHLQLLSKGKSLPAIETEPMAQVFVPESECFEEKSELCTEEKCPLDSASAKVTRNTSQVESQSSCSHMQPKIIATQRSIYNAQMVAETELEPIAQIFVTESEYYMEKNELCQEEEKLLDNEGANCSRIGSNVGIQSSLQYMEPALLAVHKSACDVGTVPEVKLERMAEVFVTDGEYLLVKNEYCKEETTLLDNDNPYCNRSINSVEIQSSSSHMQPALLGTQRLADAIGNVETIPHSATDESVLECECSSRRLVKSEPCEMTPLSNDCENVSTLKSVLNHNNIHPYCVVRPQKTESVPAISDVDVSSAADATAVLSLCNAACDVSSGTSGTALRDTDAASASDVAILSREAAPQRGSGTSGDKTAAGLSQTVGGSNTNQAQLLLKGQMDRKSSKRVSLRPHRRTNAGEQCIQCTDRGKAYTRRVNLVTHRRIHPGLSSQCEECGKAFPTLGELITHQRVHAGERPFVRRHCKSVIRHRSHVKRVRAQTADPIFQCDKCSKTFKQRGTLVLHLRIHTGVRPFKCDYCPKTFTYRGSLVIHMRIHTGDRPFKCDQCPKTFTRRDHFVIHMRIHTGYRPFKCDICSKSFKERGSLGVHMRIHAVHRPFKCEICSKGFNQRGHLVAHMCSHSRDRPFKCDKCSKTFKERRTLVVHMRIHTGDRPFKCEQCPKTFTQGGHLVIHMRSHSGHRPFKCDHCSKTFSLRGNLVTHLRIHTRRRPFKCDQCPKKFSQRESLAEHTHIHTRDRPFKCEQCSKAFKHRGHLVKHTRTHTSDGSFKCDKRPNVFT